MFYIDYRFIHVYDQEGMQISAFHQQLLLFYTTLSQEVCSWIGSWYNNLISTTKYPNEGWLLFIQKTDYSNLPVISLVITSCSGLRCEGTKIL